MKTINKYFSKNELVIVSLWYKQAEKFLLQSEYTMEIFQIFPDSIPNSILPLKEECLSIIDIII